MRVRRRSTASGVRAACAVGLASTMALAGTSAPASGASADDGARGRQQPATCPTALLPAPARGDAAVRALGADVIAVAARNRTNPRDLARHLRADRSLWVDECGDLLFIDELPSELEPVAALAEGADWPTSVTAAQAFTLHSRPGSARVILLDFDGQAISGTKWTGANGQAEWTAPAFSTDGDPSTFSDSERAVVIDVWRRVAQDYAPFDVDVTTQDPGDDAITRSDESDDEFGTRVLISPDQAQEGCSCGGRAYVDVFDLP